MSLGWATIGSKRTEERIDWRCRFKRTRIRRRCAVRITIAVTGCVERKVGGAEVTNQIVATAASANVYIWEVRALPSIIGRVEVAGNDRAIRIYQAADTATITFTITIAICGVAG